MMQLPFPSTIEPQLCNDTFLTIKTVVRKIQKNDGQTGSCAWTRQCLDKGGGGCQVQLSGGIQVQEVGVGEKYSYFILSHLVFVCLNPFLIQHLLHFV